MFLSMLFQLSSHWNNASFLSGSIHFVMSIPRLQCSRCIFICKAWGTLVSVVHLCWWVALIQILRSLFISCSVQQRSVYDLVNLVTFWSPGPSPWPPTGTPHHVVAILPGSWPHRSSHIWRILTSRHCSHTDLISAEANKEENSIHLNAFMLWDCTIIMAFSMLVPRLYYMGIMVHLQAI